MITVSSGDKPRLSTWRDWLRIYLSGACMGCADIVPGISSGTVAFVLGIYESFINAIRSFDLVAVNALVHLQLRKFFDHVAWEFFLMLFLGMATSLAVLSQFVHGLLGHPVYRVFLFALFVGLVLGAALFCSRQLHAWRPRYAAALVLGAVLALCVTLSTPAAPQPAASAALSVEALAVPGINWWLVACGMLGVCAMLLPGISGSYMLTILGAYPTVIAALADLVGGAKLLSLDTHALMTLLSVMLGMLIGAVIFSRCIGWLLTHYHNLTIATLTGFMLGALPAVWPFWSYEYLVSPVHPERGPQLHAVARVLPDVSSSTFWIAVAFVVLGFTVVTGLERVGRRD